MVQQPLAREAKAKRDRFVAFAFATAHLVLETDRAGKIVFAAGANCGLAEGSIETLVGRALVDLVDRDEQEFFRHVFGRIEAHGACQLVHIGLRAVNGVLVEFMLGGRCLDLTRGSLYFGLILSQQLEGPRKAAGYDRLEDFTKAATNRLALANTTHADEALTLFVVDELLELAQRVGPAELKAIMRAVQAYLRSVSVAGRLVGTMAPGKFGLVRAPGITDDEINANIQAILAKAGIPNSTVRAFDLPFDTKGLGESDAARALTYSIRRFSEMAPGTFDLQSLRDGASGILRDTIDTMANAKKIMSTGMIDVVYQPVVEIGSGRIHHLEALSRINGVSSIQTWIRFMEETGLVAEFDLALAAKVLETLEMHHRTGWRQRIAINLSARSLQSNLFRQQFDQLMRRHPTVAPQIMIELTETVAVRDFTAMAKALHDLQKRGHQICLDDVGAGDTSFETLRALPADFLKIDGSIMRSAVNDPHERAMLDALAALARQKNAEIIAEQIETQEQARLAHDIGAKFGQGYLFGPPSVEGIAFSNKKVHDPQWVPIKVG